MVQITFKLFASLGEYLPAGSVSNATKIEIEDQTSVVDVIETYNIPSDLVHLVLLNGVYLHPEERLRATFKEGDTLTIFPPVAGG